MAIGRPAIHLHAAFIRASVGVAVAVLLDALDVTPSLVVLAAVTATIWTAEAAYLIAFNRGG